MSISGNTASATSGSGSQAQDGPRLADFAIRFSAPGVNPQSSWPRSRQPLALFAPRLAPFPGAKPCLRGCSRIAEIPLVLGSLGLCSPCILRERLCVALMHDMPRLEARQKYYSESYPDWPDLVDTERCAAINELVGVLARFPIKNQARPPEWESKIGKLVRLSKEGVSIMGMSEEKADWRKAVLDCIKNLDEELKKAFFKDHDSRPSYCKNCVSCILRPIPMWGP
ncbi:hypothetical protein B0H67DRAFT_75387 [Lasiosphaeris hirsuta]|uniref:Uncharacterized protein n=1 Tax=Lasiosphaeris hirsuta TaxID=260670 RepID=A0AA40E970_9PEZI|nr:hypothetical protein B0H67DRAFT_75387 [Lasiosphaeris hirsuta]